MMAYIVLLCIPEDQNLNLVALYHPSVCLNVSYCARNAQYKVHKRTLRLCSTRIFICFCCSKSTSLETAIKQYPPSMEGEGSFVWSVSIEFGSMRTHTCSAGKVVPSSALYASTIPTWSSDVFSYDSFLI